LSFARARHHANPRQGRPRAEGLGAPLLTVDIDADLVMQIFHDDVTDLAGMVGATQVELHPNK